MAIIGKIGMKSWTDERARGSVHPPVILSALLAAAAAALPVGLVIARNALGKMIPWAADIEADVAVGDGTEDVFEIDLGGPVFPGSVEVADGVETFTDDGFGTLTGDGDTTPGSGKIDYSTGTAVVDFKTAPLDEAAIAATWTPMPAGVLDETVDTDESTSGMYVAHGSVRKAALKVADGDDGFEAPDAAMLKTLQNIGIFPE